MIEVEGLESGDAPQEAAEFREIYPVAGQREGAEGPDVLGHEIGSDLSKTVTGDGPKIPASSEAAKQFLVKLTGLTPTLKSEHLNKQNIFTQIWLLSGPRDCEIVREGMVPTAESENRHCKM